MSPVRKKQPCSQIKKDVIKKNSAKEGNAAKKTPHELVHVSALGVSATRMAFSNQEKPVKHTHTHSTHT